MYSDAFVLSYPLCYAFNTIRKNEESHQTHKQISISSPLEVLKIEQ